MVALPKNDINLGLAKSSHPRLIEELKMSLEKSLLD